MKINNWMNELNDFQIEFLKDVEQAIQSMGKYRYLKHIVFKKYSAYGTPTELNYGIDELIKEGYITKECQRLYNNGRFSTSIYLIVKEELIDI